MKYITSFIGIFIGLAIFNFIIEPQLPNSHSAIIREQKDLIRLQDSLIDILELANDSLRITRTEFDEAVKLLNERK